MGQDQHLENLAEIKNLMNASSKFISLSGMSGVFAGIYALLGAYAAYDVVFDVTENFQFTRAKYVSVNDAYFLIFDLALVALLSIVTGVFLSIRKAKKSGSPVWNTTSKRLVINFAIPLIVGGLFIAINMFKNDLSNSASLMLLFYGLSLINGSKYTVSHIRILGFINIGIGLLCAILPSYSFWFWVLGFGIMHIVYGFYMHLKLEK
ncbi:hypothetical protein N9901_03450 [Flavobacteriaceae bacterium]|nr:hypothetical protein [Flavobacteriaceae bacterium]